MGWAWLPLLGWAEPAAPDLTLAWRQANDVVAQFQRGHADLLKWEQKQPAPAATVPRAEPGNTLDLSTPEAAVERAWQARPKLAGTLNRLGSVNRALVLAGRWAELDPRLSWRLEGLDEAIELAVLVRKAWLQATVSQLTLAPLQTARDAAQVAQELGQRMVAVGNWSKQAQAPQQLAWANAQLNWQRAQYTAAQDRAHLLKLMDLAGRYAAVQLPSALPVVPPQAMDASAFERHMQRIQPEVPAVSRARHRAVAHLAYEAYLASHAVARLTLNGVVNTRELMAEETQLQYNGMLKSTWDLLAEVQNLAQARVSGLAAKRDFAIAELDLNWALSGAEPDNLIALTGTAADAAPAGH